MRAVCLLLLAPLLVLPAPVLASSCDAVLRDPLRSRSISVRLTMPDGARAPIPLIMWSPGLGGGLAQGGDYARAWAGAGLATLQFDHPGSNAAVYREAEASARAAPTPEAARAARAARVREGISSDQINARLADIGYAVSQLPHGFGRCRTDRIDQSRLGIAGHSMGAWMAQLLAGQRVEGGRIIARSPFKAALAVAGSPLTRPAQRAASVAAITRPFMLVTGSLDGVEPDAPPEAAAAQRAERIGLWPHLPEGEKYLFVAAGADHMQLSGFKMPPALAARLLPILTDFWVQTLKDGPSLVPPALAPGDIFEAR